MAALNPAGCGLPLCLSGIGIHPWVQALNWHRRQKGGLSQSFKGKSFAELHQIPSSEGPAQEDPLQKWRCIALALEMAELDCRREAIRKQRSERGLISYVDNQRAFVDGNSGRLHSVIGAAMQDRICAKAA